MIHVAGDLRRLGRYQDALATLETAHARLAIPHSFADQDMQQTWWWEDRALTYIALGDYPNVMESYRQAIALAEQGHPNISQVLDLAFQQMRFGHYRDALATLVAAPDTKDGRSAYGSMVFHYVHGCAAWMDGQKADAAKEVAYETAHEKDGRVDTAELLLCVGNLDGAAAVLIRELNDPDSRSGALAELGNYLSDAADTPESPARKRLPAIKARPDIRATLEKAGGAPSFPFRADDM